MPVYNCERFLENVLNGILNQTYKEFELIVIDDGSTDKSLKILKTHAKKDKRIKLLINRGNIGLTKSLNKGIRIAKGKFIVRHDGDDISRKDRIEKQVNFLLKNEEYAFCGCNGLEKKTNRKILKYFEYPDIKRNLIGENCFIHPSMVIRKSIFQKCGYYDENYLYGQDYELWCRLIYKYHLKGMNLEDILIYQEGALENNERRHLSKFIIQRRNSIKTKWHYLRYSSCKIKGIFSILVKFLEILTITKLMIFFSPFLEKIKF